MAKKGKDKKNNDNTVYKIIEIVGTSGQSRRNF